ncbi:hypothetical protein TanjilG_14065 [Lupinus angustifolius]|uniref:Uncharacterized protein n=1 Tax=Lupinus angustifolius TaxID=3871 RepID=A0A1J7GN85_LUPAN|nr:hypothetical protein TanjilG_14065 [Lupinus angustifolius]
MDFPFPNLQRAEAAASSLDEMTGNPVESASGGVTDDSGWRLSVPVGAPCPELGPEERRTSSARQRANLSPSYPTHGVGELVRACLEAPA